MYSPIVGLIMTNCLAVSLVMYSFIVKLIMINWGDYFVNCNTDN
jgi:hypothetical protein